MQFNKSYILAITLTGLLTACSEPDVSPEIVSSVPYDADSGDLLVQCGTLIDGQSDKVRKNISVLIKDGKILSVAADVGTPQRTAVIDLSAYTCMPGFIDMHTHIMEDDYTPEMDYYSHTVEHTMAKGREFTNTTFMAGFTSVRNLGVYYGGTSILMRDEINRGDAIGPRMQVASVYLTIPGGGGDIVIPDVPEESIPAHLRQGVARGPEDFRVKAQAAVDSGADVLKIIASGAVLAFGSVPGAPEMTPEEIFTVVDVAHDAGVPIVFGTDSGVYPHGMNAIQFRYMVEWGMTEMEAIKSATSVAARAMHWDDHVGTIQKGLYGDIVAVKGDPLSDIRELESIDVVIKGGLIFKAP